jgi:hypothetical protein
MITRTEQRELVSWGGARVLEHDSWDGTVGAKSLDRTAGEDGRSVWTEKRRQDGVTARTEKLDRTNRMGQLW